MRKKNEVILTRTKMEALLSAFGILKACFGEDLRFLHAIIRSIVSRREEEDREYEVEILGKLPLRTGDLEVPMHALVTFTLQEVGSVLRLSNPARVKVVGWDQALKIQTVGDPYIVLPESQFSLQQLKEKMNEYHHR